MPEQEAARSRQEVKHQNNKLHPVTFQNKTLRVNTSTHREASCLPYCSLADSYIQSTPEVKPGLITKIKA